MRYKIMCAMVALMCFFYLPVFAETHSETSDHSSITVEEIAFCTAIENRTPVDVAAVFPDTVGRVFCFTRLSSATDKTAVSHVWYYNGVQMAVVDLPVNARTWRTWSSKRIIREWTGLWKVEVISSAGNVIASDEFLVQAPPE